MATDTIVYPMDMDLKNYIENFKPGSVMRRREGMHFVRELTSLECAVALAVKELRGSNG